MTIDELLALCDGAEQQLKPPIHTYPAEWLNFRRLLGPVEIRLLIEEHAALGAALEIDSTTKDRNAAKIAHRATAMVIEKLSVSMKTLEELDALAEAKPELELELEAES